MTLPFLEIRIKIGGWLQFSQKQCERSAARFIFGPDGRPYYFNKYSFMKRTVA